MYFVFQTNILLKMNKKTILLFIVTMITFFIAFYPQISCSNKNKKNIIGSWKCKGVYAFTYIDLRYPDLGYEYTRMPLDYSFETIRFDGERMYQDFESSPVRPSFMQYYRFEDWNGTATIVFSTKANGRPDTDLSLYYPDIVEKLTKDTLILLREVKPEGFKFHYRTYRSIYVKNTP